MARYLIIGGGLAGLLTARRLHDMGHEVLVLERLNRPGGVWILSSPELVDKYTDVDILYNTTAVRVENNCVHTDRGEFCGDYVIDASGFREVTLLELGIVGDRPAGVYTLWTAMRMVELNMLPGKRVIVYGCNNWAYGLKRALEERGVEVYVVGDEYWCSDRDRVLEIRGRWRLERVLFEERGWMHFDTLILAVPKPYRWFTTELVVGNAALPIDDPKVLEVAVDSFIKSMFSERRYRVRGEVFPKETPDYVVVKVPAPGYIYCGDQVVYASEKYVTIRVNRDCEVKYVRSN